MKQVTKIKKGLFSSEEIKFIEYLVSYERTWIPHLSPEQIKDLKQNLTANIALIKGNINNSERNQKIEDLYTQYDHIDQEGYNNIIDAPMEILIIFFGQDIEDDYEIELLENYFINKR